MGQKINPFSFRLGITKNWNSRWAPRKNYRAMLEEDLLIRRIIDERIKPAGIVNVEIERGTRETYRVYIKAAKPGLIIGRGGKGVEDLATAIDAALFALRQKRNRMKKREGREVKEEKPQVNITIDELKRSDIAAQYVAQSIAWEFERRQPFRRTIKKALENILQNRDIQGAKIKVSGRLDGNEIARREQVAKGKLPLQTLRANIDYGQATAYNAYGTVGIKVWIYRGEIFTKETGAPSLRETARRVEPRLPTVRRTSRRT